MSEESNKNMKNIDESIAKAKAAQRAKMKQNDENGAEVKVTVAKPRLSPEERAEQVRKAAEAREAKKLEREAVRAQKKAEREAVAAERKAARELKKAEKAAERARKSEERKPAHMSKVEKAAAKLPELTEDLAEHVANLTEQYSVGELSRLIAHLQHSNRAKSTLESASVEFEVGEQVRIVASEVDPSLIGQVGTVTEMRKIRVLLEVEGVNRPVYLFASDCESLRTVSETPAEEPTEEECEGTDVDEEGFLTIEEDSTGTEG